MQTYKQLRDYIASQDFLFDWLELGNLEIGNFSIQLLNNNRCSGAKLQERLHHPGQGLHREFSQRGQDAVQKVHFDELYYLQVPCAQ